MTRTRPLIRLAAALAATLLLGAACAKDDGSAAAAGSGSTGSAVTGSTGGAAATGSTSGGGGGRYDYGSGGGGGNDGSGSGGGGGGGNVEIALTADNFAFSPTAIEVKAGDEISIENATSGTPHTFTIDGTDVDVVLTPGEVSKAAIDLDPGTYDFHCRFHSVMTGTLTVT